MRYFGYNDLSFLLAGLAEIGGGYLIWLWLREGKSAYLGLFGGNALVLYGIIATFQSFPLSEESMQLMEGDLSYYPYYGGGV